MSQATSERPGIIYLAVCRINQKPYVGQTTGTLRNRAMEHAREGKQIICRAIRKYGIENFDFSVIERCKSATELNEREIFWISQIGSMVPLGYNRHAGGFGPAGYGHTGNSKRKLSAARKEVWKRPEYRAKLEKSHWSRSPRAEEIRRSLSERTKQQHESGQLGGYRGGGARTPKSRAKLGESHKKLWSDPEYRAAQCASRRGKPSPRKGIKTGIPAWNRGLKRPPDSAEVIARRTASNRKRWEDPVFRARQIEKMRAGKTSESYAKAGRAISLSLAKKKESATQ